MRHYDAHEVIKFVMNETTENTDQQKAILRLIRQGKAYENAVKEIRK